MKFIQLEYFCAVSRYHSITQAAQQLYVTQPAISTAIRELEKEFSVRLFIRSKNHMTLTKEGEIFYRKAEELRQRRRNQELWLQGRYIYDALRAVSPVLHAFAKNGTQPEPYLEKPYPSDKEESKAREQEQMENQAEAFRQYVEAFNAMRRKRKEVVTDDKH